MREGSNSGGLSIKRPPPLVSWLSHHLSTPPSATFILYLALAPVLRALLSYSAPYVFAQSRVYLCILCISPPISPGLAPIALFLTHPSNLRAVSRSIMPGKKQEPINLPQSLRPRLPQAVPDGHPQLLCPRLPQAVPDGHPQSLRPRLPQTVPDGHPQSLRPRLR